MKKIIYFVRHCKAVGQEREDVLTLEGQEKVALLANKLAGAGINRIVSSPFVRAYQSIEPLSRRSNIPIETDERLIEATLSSISPPNWMDNLKATFTDYDLRFEGGETSNEATQRATAAINDVLKDGSDVSVVVTHGRLLTLILKSFDSRYGFDDWKTLTSPDVFRITIADNDSQVQRVWQ